MLIINEELFAIEKAIEQLVQDIRTSSQYQAYALAKKAFEADLALQTELALFEELKQDYELRQDLLKSCPDARALRCQLLHQSASLTCIHWLLICAWHRLICRRFWRRFRQLLQKQCLRIFLSTQDFPWRQIDLDMSLDRIKI